ncbi:MAG: glycosyltransferase family 9 protein [Candidatus Omnitrophota bacterium]|jgi:lipopolysaccharide heptosyltransferase II
MIIKRNAARKAKRILVINPFGIGDVLFTTPILRALKDKYPDCFIGYWCNERAQSILANNKNIDIIFALSRGDIKRFHKKSWFLGLNRSLKLFFEIKKNKFDTSFDFSLDCYYGFISKLAGIKERIGYDYKNRGRFLTKKTPLNGYLGKHVIEYHSDLLQANGIPVTNKHMELTVSAQAESEAEELFWLSGVKDTDLLVGIAPGAGESWGKDAVYKHWPVSNFSEVADKLVSDFNAKVLLLGDNTDMPLTDEITNFCKNKPINLAGRTSLGTLAAVIRKLNLLISNDGGPMHMAVAQGIKTVAIFGPVDDLVYGPYPLSRDQLVIKSKIECRPCYNNFRLRPCAKDKECLYSISTDEVFAAARKLLS